MTSFSFSFFRRFCRSRSKCWPVYLCKRRKRRGARTKSGAVKGVPASALVVVVAVRLQHHQQHHQQDAHHQHKRAASAQRRLVPVHEGPDLKPLVFRFSFSSFTFFAAGGFFISLLGFLAGSRRARWFRRLGRLGRSGGSRRLLRGAWRGFARFPRLPWRSSVYVRSPWRYVFLLSSALCLLF